MLKDALKVEIKKAFTNKMFSIAIGIGIFIAIMQTIGTFQYVNWVLEGSKNTIHPNGFDGISLIQLWIGGEDFTPHGAIFYLILPILAAGPYASSYYLEKKTGYASQMLIRIGKKKYLLAKWVAAFFAGSAVIAVPLLLNLMMNALICPLGRVNILSYTTAVSQRWFLYQLFYTHPIIYMLSGILLGALWGGVCSVIALAFGTLIKNKIVIQLSSFLFVQIMSFIWMYLHEVFGITDYELEPKNMMRTVSLSPNPEWIILPYILVLLGVASMIYWKRGMKRETL